MSNHASPPNSAGQTLNGCYRTSGLLCQAEEGEPRDRQSFQDRNAMVVNAAPLTISKA
jgi:hypothetical protein